MSAMWKLREAGEGYYLLVDRAELRGRAEELGYGGALVLSGRELEAGTVAAIRRSGRAVAAVYYGPGEEECALDDDAANCCRILSQLSAAHVPCLAVNIASKPWADFDHYPPSIDEALTQFPTEETLRSRLIERNLIRSTDYTDKCGNCQSALEPGDRYCRVCGTRRGEGAFQPYRNVTEVVYGPPIKKKFKCPGCGNVWIDIALGGVGSSKFCPRCGRDRIKTIGRKALDFRDWYDATEEPFGEYARPELLTDRQVLSLLSQRDGEDVWGADLLKRLRVADVEVPTRVRDDGDGSEPEEELCPRTEAEGEVLTLARHVLMLSGSNPDRDAPACPGCGSLYVADIGYEVLGRDYGVLARGVHVRTRTGDVLVTTDSHGRLRKGEGAGSLRRTAYLCLKCGNEYGEYDFAREVARTKDEDGKDLRNKASAASAHVAKVARDAASAIGGGIASFGGVVGDRLRGRNQDDDGGASS